MKKENKKFCIKCHSEISFDTQICPQCGSFQTLSMQKSSVLPQTSVPVEARSRKQDSREKPLSVGSSTDREKPKSFMKTWSGKSSGFKPFDTEVFRVTSKKIKINYSLTKTIEGELEIYLYRSGTDSFLDKISCKGNYGEKYFYLKSKGEYFLRIMPLRCTYNIILTY
jgi:hypothetical protein